MVNMLFISNKFKSSKETQEFYTPDNIHPFRWTDSISRISDYEIVVLDLAVSGGGFQGVFWQKRDEIYNLLDSGGVVICLTSPTVKDQYNQTNYDWLNKEHAKNLNLLENKGSGINIKVISKNDKIKKYFEDVKSYSKTMGHPKTIYYDEKVRFERIKIEDKYWPRLNKFAINKVTGESISCEIKIGRGSLIFLPQSIGLHVSSTIGHSIESIYNIGEDFYEKNKMEHEGFLEKPEWVDKYIPSQEIQIKEKIENVKKELEKSRNDKRRFENIDILLYGHNDSLEEAVKKVLEEFGCVVEKMERGYTIDLKANKNSFMFALEVTGIKDKINKSSNKFNQIFQYRIEKEPNEKMMLIANTYRDRDITERPAENFTKDPIDIPKVMRFV